MAWAVAGVAAQARDLPTGPLPPLPDQVTAVVTVYPQAVLRPVSPRFVGVNVDLVHQRQLLDPAIQRQLQAAGLSSLRFPGGCGADTYNWRNPGPDTLTVDEVLAACDAMGTEAYYTLNMQGGTEGLVGPPPPGSPLEERIRYRHTAPNPCGMSGSRYHFGTVEEAVELLEKYTIQRALAGRTPITHYELGNENWGQWNTDWPPDVYAKTCEEYASALRLSLEEAKTQHPALAGLSLYIVMVGFPSTGNNMDPLRAVNRAANVAWTAEVNNLGRLGLIDSVQEHFYVYGNNNGDTLYWTAHNLHNILALRQGIPSPRLAGHVDGDLLYDEIPMEVTEWNIKCWGTAATDDIPSISGGFEDGMSGWTAQAEPVGTGVAVVSPAAARHGSAGLELTTASGATRLEARQTFPVAKYVPAHLLGAGAWVRSHHPVRLHVMLRQANAGVHEGVIHDDRAATQTDMWERVVVAFTPPSDLTDLEVIIRLEGENARAWVDEVKLICWPTDSRGFGYRPLAAQHFEQQLFLVDFLRGLLEWGVPRTHYHTMFDGASCGLMNRDGTEHPNIRPFQMLKDRIGTQVVRTDVEVPTLAYNTYADAHATDFNGLAPDMTAVPALAVTTTRRDDELYMIMVNRTTDRPVSTSLRVAHSTLRPMGEVRTLSGSDADLPGAAVTTASLAVSSPMTHVVLPQTAQVIRIGLDRVIDAPMVIEPTRFDHTVLVGRSPSDDLFAVRTGGPDALSYIISDDTDWLMVLPPDGASTGEARPATVRYDTLGLAPGHYAATIKVSSDDAYNSPQRIAVTLTVKAIRSDFDQDGDVDEEDLRHFQACLTGPAVPPATPHCVDADLDGDHDVDQDDFAIFTRCISGPDCPVDPDCD